MITPLTFDQAMNEATFTHARDRIASLLLIGIPELGKWGLIDLRNPAAVADAIARVDITPASYIGAVEIQYWSSTPVNEKMESVLMELLSHRDHQSHLVNMLEVYNIAHNSALPEEAADGVSEQPKEVHSNDGVAIPDEEPRPISDSTDEAG